MSDSVWPHGLQPARLLSPWDFSRQEYRSELPRPPPGESSWPGDQTHVSCIDGQVLHSTFKKSSTGSVSLTIAFLVLPQLTQIPVRRLGTAPCPMEWFGEQLFPGSTYKVKAVQHNLWWADPKINPKHQVLHEMIPNNHLLTDINWTEWTPKVRHTHNRNS